MSFWNARSRKASGKGQYGKVAKGNNSFWSTSDPYASSSQDDARQIFYAGSASVEARQQKQQRSRPTSVTAVDDNQHFFMNFVPRIRR